jgi:activator of HSP90 ATPase
MRQWQALDRNLNGVNRRQAIRIAAVSMGGVAIGSAAGIACAAGDEEVSHTAESIHQEVVFKASRKRVFETLTQAKEFDKVVRLSAAMQGGMPPSAPPTEISTEVGGTFAIFAGHIIGRHLEFVPHERIVQAWRVVDWNAGDYSIAKFELVEQGAQTKLMLEHKGFPKGLAEHLAEGWRINYWEPLGKMLAAS